LLVSGRTDQMRGRAFTLIMGTNFAMLGSGW
jgi:hypothetical protein